jgi:hypothetical protein
MIVLNRIHDYYLLLWGSANDRQAPRRGIATSREHAPSQRNPNGEARGEGGKASNIIVLERQDGGVEGEGLLRRYANSENMRLRPRSTFLTMLGDTRYQTEVVWKVELPMQNSHRRAWLAADSGAVDFSYECFGGLFEGHLPGAVPEGFIRPGRLDVTN